MKSFFFPTGEMSTQDAIYKLQNADTALDIRVDALEASVTYLSEQVELLSGLEVAVPDATSSGAAAHLCSFYAVRYSSNAFVTKRKVRMQITDTTGSTAAAAGATLDFAAATLPIAIRPTNDVTVPVSYQHNDDVMVGEVTILSTGALIFSTAANGALTIALAVGLLTGGGAGHVEFEYGLD